MHSVVARRLLVMSCGEGRAKIEFNPYSMKRLQVTMLDCVELAWSYMRADEVFILQGSAHRPRGNAYKEGKKA